ncbi:MAG: hypothetical protein OSB36_08980, partial [Longimicrobiales bacterium]|nr:hypothetical protein [Longimicrobiales bacterium]
MEIVNAEYERGYRRQQLKARPYKRARPPITEDQLEDLDRKIKAARIEKESRRLAPIPEGDMEPPFQIAHKGSHEIEIAGTAPGEPFVPNDSKGDGDFRIFAGNANVANDNAENAPLANPDEPEQEEELPPMLDEEGEAEYPVPMIVAEDGGIGIDEIGPGDAGDVPQDAPSDVESEVEELRKEKTDMFKIFHRAHHGEKLKQIVRLEKSFNQPERDFIDLEIMKCATCRAIAHQQRFMRAGLGQFEMLPNRTWIWDETSFQGFRIIMSVDATSRKVVFKLQEDQGLNLIEYFWHCKEAYFGSPEVILYDDGLVDLAFEEYMWEAHNIYATAIGVRRWKEISKNDCLHHRARQCLSSIVIAPETKKCIDNSRLNMRVALLVAQSELNDRCILGTNLSPSLVHHGTLKTGAFPNEPQDITSIVGKHMHLQRLILAQINSADAARLIRRGSRVSRKDRSTFDLGQFVMFRSAHEDLAGDALFLPARIVGFRWNGEGERIENYDILYKDVDNKWITKVYARDDLVPLKDDIVGGIFIERSLCLKPPAADMTKMKDWTVTQNLQESQPPAGNVAVPTDGTPSQEAASSSGATQGTSQPEQSSGSEVASASQSSDSMQEPVKEMKLSIISGSMFAGKTTELINRYQRTEGVKAVYSPATDSRTGTGRIRTHNGRTIKAVTLSTIADIVSAVRMRPELTEVFIEEIHLWPDPKSIVDLVQSLSTRSASASLHICGLCLTLDRIEFQWRTICREIEKSHPNVKTDVIFIRGTCDQCATIDSSVYTVRRDGKSTAEINRDNDWVGGGDKYMSICAECTPPSLKRSKKTTTAPATQMEVVTRVEPSYELIDNSSENPWFDKDKHEPEQNLLPAYMIEPPEDILLDAQFAADDNIVDPSAVAKPRRSRNRENDRPEIFSYVPLASQPSEPSQAPVYVPRQSRAERRATRNSQGNRYHHVEVKINHGPEPSPEATIVPSKPDSDEELLAKINEAIETIEQKQATATTACPAPKSNRAKVEMMQRINHVYQEDPEDCGYRLEDATAEPNANAASGDITYRSFFVRSSPCFHID